MAMFPEKANDIGIFKKTPFFFVTWKKNRAVSLQVEILQNYYPENAALFRPV